MIDIGELHDKMISYRLVGFTKSDISTIDALEILGRLQQAEKDAARYRWLRDVGCFEGSADDLFHATPEETDAEFDRFMQCNK